MGTFSYRIEVGDPSGRRFEPVEAFVDTGATFTVIPIALLRRLGISSHRTTRFRLADGNTLDRDIGEARVRLDGQEMTTTVVFGNDDQPAILGAVTLETALLAVDPVGKRLIPTEGLLI